MKPAFITPTPMLNAIATQSTTHLVLSHIYEVDPEYRAFYKERVAAGDFVMLDNSAYELGESVDLSRLLRCAEDLNPSAVFVPDCRFNTERTIALAEEAIQVLSGRGWQLFGVPQGSNLAEILRCYHWFGENPAIHGFGLYEEIGEVAGLGIRKFFLKYLQNHDHIYSDKYYHLLGMEEDLTQIQALGKFSFVNSIDSAKAVVYGLNDIELTEDGTDKEYPHRPKDFFGRHLTEKQYPIILNNVLLVNKWARG